MTPTPSIPVPTARRPWGQTVFDDPPPTVRVSTTWNPTQTPPPLDRFSGSSLGFDDAPQERTGLRLPHVGEMFLGFKLVEELGRGAFAKVFLAEQVGLAGRHVALKVTRRATHEAERLARLHHTNIVPVYSVHDLHPVQAICMPFLGRRTIVDGLKAFHRGNYSSRRGSSARSSRATVASGPKWPGSSPSTPEIIGPITHRTLHTFPDAHPLIGNVEAVLRLLSALAEGLSHAHGRNILHLDIKPANVLLADSGVPMLLDFNLAYDTTAAVRDIVGGTPQYMAPEQLADVKSHGLGKVDARTDLYSLGVLAYEMLTGDVPFPAPSTRKPGEYDRLAAARRQPLKPVRERNPDVTPAVESILQKMLAPDPERRYQSADDLREDLGRQLNNRPLTFAPEPSLRERCAKWKRRNPKLFVRLAAMVLLGLGVAGGAALRREALVLSEKAAVTQARETHAALHPLRIDLVFNDAARTRGKARAADLLGKYGLPDDPDWQSRATFARLPEAKRAEVAAELGELLLLLAEAQWQDARANPNADLRAIACESLRLNRLARTCFPPDAAPPYLVRQQAELAAHTADPPDRLNPPTQPGVAKTPRDHFLEAVWFITANRYEAALDPLQAVVRAEPDHAAAQYSLAACRHQLGQHARALERYDVAQSLLPADPRPPMGRGLIYGMERRAEKAEAEFSDAITLDPKFGEAYWNRALARMKLGKPELAEDDLTTALDLNVSALQVYWIRADAREARGDADGAEADRKAAAFHEPKGERDYLVRACSRVRSDPKAALADFRCVIERNPTSISALMNQTHLLADHHKDLPGALVSADRLVEVAPEYAPGRAARAVILARLGKRAEAHAEADRAKKCFGHAAVTYQIACVYAITAGQGGDQVKADRAKAIALLRQAFKDGYHEVRHLATDPDLDALRTTHEFTALVNAMKELAR